MDFFLVVHDWIDYPCVVVFGRYDAIALHYGTPNRFLVFVLW